MQSSSSGSNGRPKGGAEEFIDVWARNLEDEFARLRRLVRKYPYVAMVSVHANRVCINWRRLYIVVLVLHLWLVWQMKVGS